MVDLDATLLHTSIDHVVRYDESDEVIRWQFNEVSDWQYTKLRPHAIEFLHEMSELFELRICTMGESLYARKMAALLDSSGVLFGSRIHARDDLADRSSKSKMGHLSTLFPCGDATVVIIDDREDVWDSSSNLIRVEPYRFFTRNSADDKTMFAPCFDFDDHLLHVKTLLRKVHRDYFDALNACCIDESLPLPCTKPIVANVTWEDSVGRRMRPSKLK